MLRDIELFTSKLGKLDGFGDAGEYLTKIINGKEIKTLRVSAPTEEEAPKEDKPNGDDAENEENKSTDDDKAPAPPAKDDVVEDKDGKEQ